MENQNIENGTVNQETQEQQPVNNTNQQPAPEPQMEEVGVIEIPLWAAKAIKVTKKVLKIALPFATAALGVFAGVKYGSSKEAKLSQAQSQVLNGTIEDLRRQLDERPALPEIPAADTVPTITEIPDIIPVDVIE